MIRDSSWRLLDGAAEVVNQAPAYCFPLRGEERSPRKPGRRLQRESVNKLLCRRVHSLLLVKITKINFKRQLLKDPLHTYIVLIVI